MAQLYPTNVVEAWVTPQSSTGNQGQGVKVGILDSGAQATNPALLNRITWFTDYVDPTNTTPQDGAGHGTVMAEVIGGTANPFGSGGNPFYGGVAPQSLLYVARIGDDSGNVNVALAPQALADLNAQGVKLINNSYGSTTQITGVGSTNSLVTEDYSIYKSTAANGQLMVWAAGNNGMSQPSVEAGLPYYETSLQENWLAVVNVSLNANGQVTGLDTNATSNACGVAAAWCLAAPGYTYVTPVANTPFSTGAGDGTSGAAAVVTGVAALVWQKYPFFTATNVQETLLGTATNLGSPSFYGYGLVNAAAAVNGPEQLNWGTFDVNIPTGESGTFSNNLSGTGTIQLDGNGSLTLTGSNNLGGLVVNGGTLTAINGGAFTSNVQVNGGTLTVGGYVTAPQALIAPGATLACECAISGSVVNNGTFDGRSLPFASDPAGFFPRIEKNYTTSASSNTILELGYVLTVGNNTTLNGGILTIDVPHGYEGVSDYPVLWTVAGSTGTISGQFSSMVLDSDIYETGTLYYGPTVISITLQTQSVTSVAQASMPHVATTQQTAQHLQTALIQANSWAASDPAAHQTFLTAADQFYSVYSVAQAAASINSLSGQLLASSQGLTFEQAGIVNRTVADRLVDIGNGDAQQGAWFQGTGASGDVARTGYATGHYNGGGSVAGYDVKVVDDFTLGVGMDWNRLGSDYSLQGGSNSSRSTGVMLYGKFARDNFYLSARVGEDWIHSDTSRWGLLGMVPAAITSLRNDEMTSAYLEAGFDAKSDAWTTTPFVSAGDEHLDRGAIAEQGAGGFGIAAPSDNFNQSYAQIGARLAYHWSWSNGQLSLKGFALYQRVLSGQNLGFTAAYAGAPNATFELEGVNSPRNTGWVGVGLNADMNKHWTVFASLDGQVAGGDTKATVFSAGARYSF